METKELIKKIKDKMRIFGYIDFRDIEKSSIVLFFSDGLMKMGYAADDEKLHIITYVEDVDVGESSIIYELLSEDVLEKIYKRIKDVSHEQVF